MNVFSLIGQGRVGRKALHLQMSANLEDISNGNLVPFSSKQGLK